MCTLKTNDSQSLPRFKCIHKFHQHYVSSKTQFCFRKQETNCIPLTNISTIVLQVIIVPIAANWKGVCLQNRTFIPF